MTSLLLPGRRLGELAELDRRLVQVAARIRVLGALSFPQAVAEVFRDGWARGQPRLPDPPTVSPVPRPAVEALDDIARRADCGDPLGRFVHDTARSYRKVAAMLDVPGTAEFHALSREIYGGPAQPLVGMEGTHLQAADRLLEATAALTAATQETESDYCLTPAHVAELLQRRIDTFFRHDYVQVVIDPGLSAKAAASATRVRLRGQTAFSQLDIDQLFEHEALVHAATALNGRKQARLSSLSLGAPRTTATQEGLATFAELVTGVMDLARLRRLALRIRAVHLAEEGADLVQVCEFLHASGQSESESVQSALRVFRGGDLRGRHPFTKDVVYLRGLIGVHTFLHKAIEDVRPGLIARLFVGRLTVGDALRLEEAFEEGAIAPPVYVPAWAQNIRALAAYLSFSVVLNRIDLPRVDIRDLLTDPAEAGD